MEELKSYHGTPEVLREAADAIDDSYLSSKLDDIALLYGDFLKETMTKGQMETEQSLTTLSVKVVIL